MSDLKPCPFCGCPDIYLTFRADHYYGYEIPVIFCNHCKVSVEAEDDSPFMDDRKSYKWMQEKVMKVWNSRGEKTDGK